MKRTSLSFWASASVPSKAQCLCTGQFGEKTMTKKEWLRCTEPGSMLEFLRGKVTDRKLRLFGVACCRSAFYGELCVFADEESLLLRQMLDMDEWMCDRLSTV